RFVSAGSASLLHFPRKNLMAQNLAIGGVVVDNQDAQVEQVLIEGWERWAQAGNFLEFTGEPEGRAAAGFALHADLSAQHAHELLRDCQPQAGAAVSASCGP